MMNWKPRVRSDSAPMASEANIETRMASGHAMNALVTPDTISMPAAYAPTPKSAAWPKVIRPV